LGQKKLCKGIKYRTMAISEAKITRSYHRRYPANSPDCNCTSSSRGRIFSRTTVGNRCWVRNLPECLKRQNGSGYFSRQTSKAPRILQTQEITKHCGNCVIVNSFLVLLNLVSAGGLSWSLYIVLFWGLGLGLDTWNTYQYTGEEYEEISKSGTVSTYWNNQLIPCWISGSKLGT